MRILQVITDTDRRGAQVFALDLEAELRGFGHEVTTVALAEGLRLPHLDVAVLGARSRGLRTLWRLRRAMGDVDVTIAHGSSTLLACAIAGLGRGRPFVYRQISDSKYWASTRLRRLRVAAYLVTPRRVVALSELARSQLHGYLFVRLDRISVIPNAVSRTRFYPGTADAQLESRRRFGLPNDAVVALYVGALVPEKGVDAAIRALAEAPMVHLLVVGGGPDRERLQSLSDAICSGRVHFAGELIDPLAAYHAADFSVLSSKSEAMPATIIEASLCGLPSVSVRVGSIEEVVRDRETGCLVEPGDAAALASAIAWLASDSELRFQLGNAARLRSERRFEIGAAASHWDALLRGLQ